jgi:hypothetical protein
MRHAGHVDIQPQVELGPNSKCRAHVDVEPELAFGQVKRAVSLEADPNTRVRRRAADKCGLGSTDVAFETALRIGAGARQSAESPALACACACAASTSALRFAFLPPIEKPYTAALASSRFSS